MIRSVASFCERHTRVVVLVWVGAAVALTLGAPSLRDVVTQDNADFLPASSPSQRAQQLMEARFPQDPGRDSVLVLLHRPTGLAATDQRYMDELSGFLRSPAMVTDIDAVEFSPMNRAPDKQAQFLVVGLRAGPFTNDAFDAVHRLREHLDRTAPAGLAHAVTGAPALAADQADVGTESFARIAIVSVVLVLVILLFIYRSPVAALIPLVTIGLAYLVARGLIALLGQHGGLEIAGQTETIMLVIVFGAGTDYCLFIVSRYREELGGGGPLSATIQRTVTVVGAVIAASAATVIVAFLSQLTADFGFFRSMGPAIALAVAVTLVCALTLTPALFHVLGRRAFWPARTDVAHDPAGISRGWELVAGLVRRHPRELSLGGMVLLLLPAAGLGWLRQSFDLIEPLPASAEARQGYETLSEHFPGGLVSPVSVIIQTDAPVLDGRRLAALDRLSADLRRDPAIAQVSSLTQPAGDPAAPRLLKAPPPSEQKRLAGFLGADGRSTRLVLALRGNPYNGDALAAVSTLDDRVEGLLTGTPLADADVAVGGVSALTADMRAAGDRDLRRVSIVLFVGIFFVLAFLLRSVVAPVYLLATVVVSFAATMGLTAAVFQGVFGVEGIAFWLPHFLLIILVALGADYNIFIMSRVREEAAAGYDLTEAAARGLVLTGHVITSAGFILAGTFAALMLAPLTELRQMGFAVTVGVLIDTFIVRSMLVPSIVVLLGRFAFWPSAVGAPLGHRIRRRELAVSGAALTVVSVIGVAAVVFGR